MTHYRIWDEGAEEVIEAESMEEAREQAVEWLNEGWSSASPDATFWPAARVGELDADGNVTDQDSVSITIHPEPPECHDGGDHKWDAPHEIVGGITENPGCWCHGGGVITHEVCLRCGTDKTTDGWAQVPSTGEQGLESIAYEEGLHSEQLEDIARDNGTRIGRAMARDVLAEDMPRKWSGLDPQDADEIDDVLQGQFRELVGEHAEYAYDDALATG